jgi:2-keto-4-pentenoate hydratase
MQTSANTIAQSAAGILIEARRQRQPARLNGASQPQNNADAYAIQDAVAAQLWPQARISAWKLGAPDAVSEPNTAPIGPSLLVADGSTLQASDFLLIAIEGELAFRLARDLPPKDDGSEYSSAQVAAAVASVHPTIEIVDSRLQDWQNADALAKLADFQSNGALVVGPAVTDWQRINPLTQPAQLIVNGATIVETQGGNAARDLLRLLTWQANHVVRRCGGLQAGDVVTTGSFTGVQMVPPGADVSVVFPGVGSVAVRFTNN